MTEETSLVVEMGAQPLRRQRLPIPHNNSIQFLHGISC